MFYIFYLIKNNSLEPEKIDKISELFKYTIVTIGIGTVAFIVIDTFKERDYDKDEMLVFNQYLPYITDTTATIEKKISFCKFFSSVTPKGDLKKGWISYTEFLINEKDKVNNQDKKNIIINDELESSNNPNAQFVKIEETTTAIQKTLNNVNVINADSFLVVIGADINYEETNEVTAFAKNKIGKEATIYKKGKWYITVIPSILNFQEAQKIAKEVKLKSKGMKDAYVVTAKSWCKSGVKSENENCIICE